MKLLKSITAVLLFSVLAVCTALSAGDHQIKNFKLDKKDGIYKCGETITVSGLVCDRKKPLTVGTLLCNIKWEGTVVETQKAPCNGKPFKITYKNNKPGWVYFEFRLLDKDGKEVKNPAIRIPQRVKAKYLLAEIGAMYEPEKIRSTVPEPADFDEFWQKQMKKLTDLPMDPVIKEIDSKDPAVKLYAVEVKCTGGRPATAYLAIPANAKAKSCGAIVDFLSLSWRDANKNLAVRRAKQGIIGVSATWHGLPLGQKDAFYKKKRREHYKNDLHRRNVETPEKWFFTAMCLRSARILQFTKSLPEWNGKDLVVQGGSLGGAQAAFAAAIDPAVSMAVISVTTFCEFRGSADGRKNSIPFHRPNVKNTDAMYNGAKYIDLVYLCKRIKCESFFCTGFADEGCTPSNVYAAYNNIPDGVKKDIYTNPYTGHFGSTKNVKGNERIASMFRAVTVY